MGFNRCDLFFREVEYLDLPLLRQWRNDPRMSPGWHSAVSVQTLEQQTNWYKALSSTNQAYLVYEIEPTPKPQPLAADPAGIIEQYTRRLPSRAVGMLRFTLDPVNNEARITGVDVVPSIQGKAFGRRILRAGVEYVLNDLGYHRATGEAMDGNTGAIKIILAAGMKQEGTLRKYVWRKGAWQDWHIYSILREELWPEETGVAAG